jgi:hypothetical protein
VVIDTTRLMHMKSDADRYRSELRVLASDAGVDTDIANALHSAAINLANASWALQKAVQEASGEEAE